MNENVIINKLNEIENKLDNKKEDRFINLAQLREYSSLSSSTIYRSIASGRLKGKKSSQNGKWIFSMENVKRWLNG